MKKDDEVDDDNGFWFNIRITLFIPPYVDSERNPFNCEEYPNIWRSESQLVHRLGIVFNKKGIFNCYFFISFCNMMYFIVYVFND